MTKKNVTFFIFLNMVFMAFLSCEGMATLFHGPKPEEKEPTFTVTFEANGAAGIAPASQTVTLGTTVTLPGEGGLSFSGKVFMGWSVSPSGAGTTYTPGYLFSVSGNQTFYARWITAGEIQQYTVTFNANGAGSGTPPTPQTVYSGISISIPNQGSLVNTGKNFAGWNTAADGTGINYNAGTAFVISANLTLYAQWVDPSVQRYTVTYLANGASGSPPSAQTVNAGTGITLPGQGSLFNSGKTFNGWNTAANGSGTGYAEGASYTVNGNASFYAQWLNEPVVPPGATLAAKLAYIAGRADDGANYDIVVSNNEYLGPTTISTRGRNVAITIHSASAGDIKTIGLTSVGSLFSVSSNISLKLQNIILEGMSANNNALVQVGQGAVLELETGAKVKGNTNIGTKEGGGVYISGGTLILNGGEISGNTAGSASLRGRSYGGGICVDNSGMVTIKDGLISNNQTNSNWLDANYGGGIYITNNSTVTMNGGTVDSNIASAFDISGGGVYISSTGTFIKRPASGSTTSGVIFGYPDSMANKTLSDGNPVNNGAALYRYNGTTKNVNRTLGEFDHISSQSDTGWE